jgi:hypothetical protein
MVSLDDSMNIDDAQAHIRIADVIGPARANTRMLKCLR